MHFFVPFSIGRFSSERVNIVIGICKFHGTLGLQKLKQILNFDKFKPPLCGFQFSYLKLLVKNCCDLFQKYVNSNTA